MRIWIDGKEANVFQRLGSSQVAFNLIRSLEKIDKKNDYTILLPEEPLEDLPKTRKEWDYKILWPNKLWTRIALPLALYSAKLKPDLIFSPTHYIPRFSPVKRVVTIFDLSYLHFPDMFNKKDLWQLTNWSKFSIENADHIITISNFSKKDIVDQYRIDKSKITVAYPGYDQGVFNTNIGDDRVKQVLTEFSIEGAYIIYIGTVQPRKNLIRLIEAVGRIEDIKLIVVGKTKGKGKQGWMYEDILKRPKELGIEDRVIFTGFVETEKLPPLIKGAVAFIQPSLYEGFGIPVVEAMACGTPVVVSNVSSLGEVVGEAGLVFNPYSVDQIEQAIRTITADKRLRTRFSKLGIKRAKKFSWEAMAKTILKTFTN
ncbi:glycosyltransferase family 4 protein [Candidatus Daviesbacteria bacterium]|nr:glycosyltransferase family 4 protein [Candidatus Daviesbacteria bacterium]